MSLPFRQLKKLWLVYLFLLFFAFFMFALSINVYLQSIYSTDLLKKNVGMLRRGRMTDVVVGHYIGFGTIHDNLTREELDRNGFDPIEGEGALGNPVSIPAKDSIKMQRAFQIHKYNILASDRIPLNRTLRDYRMENCKTIKYDPKQLPTTSVIIVFHNEAWSVLLRTIWSVINRSPFEVLTEIILVDDASNREFLGKPLEDHIASLPVKTQLFRLKTRQGLVAARLLGASNAKGGVLTFLDAHCECSVGWLEPILARIKENRKSVVCPVIDIISDDNFSYTKTLENNLGVFNWHLSYRWQAAVLKDNSNFTKPIPSPGMAGGLFSIDKNYFYEMGAYDDKMRIWGGENIEISFRIWQCGGSIEISPCSHVGHVFRKGTPYTFPGGASDVISNNLARAAMVWMDQWQNFFLKYSGIGKEFINSLDINERMALRKKLNCKSFEWYLTNIWPDHFFPAEDRFFGKIIWLTNKTELEKMLEKRMRGIPIEQVPTKLIDTLAEVRKLTDLHRFYDPENDQCLRIREEAGRKILVIGNCVQDSNLYDLLVMSPKGQIMSNNNMCLDYYNRNDTNFLQTSNVRIQTCADHPRQHWDYRFRTQQIVHQNSQMCLTIKDPKVSFSLMVAEKCIPNDRRQMWGFLPMPWKTY